MNQKTFIPFLTFIFLWLSNADAQYFISGQDPASVKWQQIRTDYFRIIFPKENYEQARKLTFLTSQTYPYVNAGLKAPAIRSDLIMHGQASISNAMVAWAPRRLDFFHQPSQDGYSQEWLRQLSLHELRHVAQISSLNTEVGKAASILIGQQATAAILGIFVPQWFMEGDAVVTETAMSYSGRGRQSLFESGLRAQLLEKGKFSYDKAYFGSFRDHVPNIYELGYYFVGYQRYKHGEDLWQEMLAEVASFPFLLNPFNRAVKRKTGQNKNRLYKESMIELMEKWNEQDQKTEVIPATKISPDKKKYTNYRFAQPLSDGSIIALRSAINDINRIVRITNNKEQVLFTPGSLFAQNLSVTDSLVVWNEYQEDPRWENRSFSVIKTGNINTKEIRQLTHQTKLFAPTISADNKKILASEASPNGRYALVILDASNGNEISRYENDSLFFQIPLWMDDHVHILATAVGKEGKALLKINSITHEMELLIPFSNDDFALSSVHQNTALIHGSWSGISNIFAFDITTKKLKQLTSSRFGAAFANTDKSGVNIVFSDYSSDGWQIRTIKTTETLSKPIESVQNNAFPLGELLAQDQVFNIDTLRIPDTIFLAKPYSKFKNLFHFHSWAPIYIEAENEYFGPGISLFSQNTLSTFISELGFNYDANQQTGRTSANFNWYGWYPVIKAGVGTGQRKDETIYMDELVELKWWETDWNISMSLPLNYTRNKWVSGIQPAIGFRQLYRKMDKSIGLNFEYEFTSSLVYELYAYRYLRMSSRDLIPKTGIIARSIFRHSPLDKEPSKQLYGSATLFLPGIAKHHGIKIFAAAQKEEKGLYNYGSLVPAPRGYINLFYGNAHTIRTDYVLPIAYPEWNWPAVAYFKRLSGSLFFDYLEGVQANNVRQYCRSTGFELLSDWHFFNFPAPINIGMRFSANLDENLIMAEIMFGVNFNAIR